MGGIPGEDYQCRLGRQNPGKKVAVTSGLYISLRLMPVRRAARMMRRSFAPGAQKKGLRGPPASLRPDALSRPQQ